MEQEKMSENLKKKKLEKLENKNSVRRWRPPSGYGAYADDDIPNRIPCFSKNVMRWEMDGTLYA